MVRLYRRYVTVGITVFVILVFWFYFVSLWTTSTFSSRISSHKKNQSTMNLTALMSQPIVYVWCCVTNIIYSRERQVLKNFKILVKSLLQTSTCRLSINVIGDIQDRNTILNTIFKTEDEVGSMFYEVSWHITESYTYLVEAYIGTYVASGTGGTLLCFFLVYQIIHKMVINISEVLSSGQECTLQGDLYKVC